MSCNMISSKKFQQIFVDDMTDWEVYDLQDVQKIVDMPDTLTIILKELDIIKKQKTNSSTLYSDLVGSSYIGFFLNEKNLLKSCIK